MITEAGEGTASSGVIIVNVKRCEDILHGQKLSYIGQIGKYLLYKPQKGKRGINTLSRKILS